MNPTRIIPRHRTKHVRLSVMAISAPRFCASGQAPDDCMEEACDDTIDGSSGSSDIIVTDVITCQVEQCVRRSCRARLVLRGVTSLDLPSLWAIRANTYPPKASRPTMKICAPAVPPARPPAAVEVVSAPISGLDHIITEGELRNQLTLVDANTLSTQWDGCDNSCDQQSTRC